MNLDFNNMIPELHYYIHRKCTPNWKIEPHVIPFIDITYVIDGKAEYNIGGRTYIVKKGDLICIPQNTTDEKPAIPPIGILWGKMNAHQPKLAIEIAMAIKRKFFTSRNTFFS